MSRHRYSVVDVFGHAPLRGNPVAVVHGADGIDDARMQAFARWTNLSETTFLLEPAPYEDPVTGSLNAGTGEWLMASGRAPAAYVAAQGSALQRDGRVHLRSDGAGRLLVGGTTHTIVQGEVEL